MKFRIKMWSIRGSVTVVAGFFMLLMAAPVESFAASQWDVGVSGGEHGIDGFHLSIGEYYNVPEREVVVVHDRGIDDDELPVVFFLSRHAHVPPEVIVDMRIRGMSWWDISMHYGLDPEIYYVPVPVYSEGHYPHGHAYGYYNNYRHRNDWRRIHLSDRDMVNQVNLGFMRDHYRYDPDRVMRYRSEGKRFSAIDQEIWRERNGKGNAHYYADQDWRHGHNKESGKKPRDDNWQGNGNDKGHGNGKGNGHGNGNGGNNNWQDDDHGGGKSHGK